MAARVARCLAALVWVGLSAIAGCGGPPTEVAIRVTEAGFVPSTLEVPRGRPLVVTFVRTVAQTCASDVMFPSLHRGYDLPLGDTVRVEIPASALRDSLRFTCTTQVIGGWIVPR